MFIYIYLTFYSFKSQREWKVSRLRKRYLCVQIALRKRETNKKHTFKTKTGEKKSSTKTKSKRKTLHSAHTLSIYRRIDYVARNHSNQAYVRSVKPHSHYIIQTLLCPDKQPGELCVVQARRNLHFMPLLCY